MTIGASLFLIATGAILRYAVTWHLSWIRLPTLGLILMIIGAVGLLLGVLLIARGRWEEAPPWP